MALLSGESETSYLAEAEVSSETGDPHAQVRRMLHTLQLDNLLDKFIDNAIRVSLGFQFRVGYLQSHELLYLDSKACP